MLEGSGRSSFNNHAVEIYTLFRAASDIEMPPTDDCSIQDRIDLVFRELALINRAHNFDEYRFMNGIREQFDYMRGDSPSCRSGELKRLIQSLLYYPYEIRKFDLQLINLKLLILKLSE